MKIHNRLSFSRFKKLIFGCEEAALEEIFKPTEATVRGQLVEAIATNQPIDEILEENAGLCLKKNGEHKKFVEDSKVIALRAVLDEKFMEVMNGAELQKKVEFKIDGVPWLGYADIVNGDYVYDLKSTADINKKVWSEKHRMMVPFYVDRMYDLQGAVYTKGLGLPYFSLLAISPKDFQEIIYPSYQLENAWEVILKHNKHAWALLQGEIKPRRCEKCSYCMSTRKRALKVTAEDCFLPSEQLVENIYEDTDS